MKRWKKLLMGVLSFGVLLIVVGFFLPQCHTVERRMTTTATPKQLFPYVATLRQWPEWTAWNTNRFPDMTADFEGSELGVGAVMHAHGKSSGNGRVTITRAEPDQGVWYELDFENGTQLFYCSITYATKGSTREITWQLRACFGRNVLKRWAGLLLDPLMGGDLETGLARLVERAESK